MNLTHKKSLMLAVAAALGMVTPFAQASLITSLTDGTDTTAVKFALEEQGEATKEYYGRTVTSGTGSGALTEQDLTIHIPVVAGYTVTQANRMIVRVTLTGGAKFANKPYLICASTSIGSNLTTTIWSDGTLGNAAANGSLAACLINATNGNLTGPAAGTTCNTGASELAEAASGFSMSPDTGGKGAVTATFTLPEKLITRVGVTNGSGAGCILTFGREGDLSNLASAGSIAGANSAFVTAFTIGSRQDIGLKAEITYVDAGINTIKTYQGTIIKFVTALAATIGAGDTQTIDVGKKSSKEFTNGTIVPIGTFNLITPQTTMPRVSKSYVDFVAGNENLVSAMVSGFSITVAGSTVAGAKQVWLDDGATCNGTRYALTQVAATSGGSSVTLTVTAIADPATGPNYFSISPNPMGICLEVPGTTILSDGQLTATLTGLPKSTSFVLDLGAGGNLSKIDRNGAVVRVLNIPAKDNADQVYIRFYNTSSQPTQVRATLYGQDGKVIGTENAELFSALKANDVEILDAAKLQTKFNVTAPWTGRAWLLIQADVDKEAFKVQALIRTPGTPGVLTNLSGEAYN